MRIRFPILLVGGVCIPSCCPLRTHMHHMGSWSNASKYGPSNLKGWKTDVWVQINARRNYATLKKGNVAPAGHSLTERIHFASNKMGYEQIISGWRGYIFERKREDKKRTLWCKGRTKVTSCRKRIFVDPVSLHYYWSLGALRRVVVAPPRSLFSYLRPRGGGYCSSSSVDPLSHTNPKQGK